MSMNPSKVPDGVYYFFWNENLLFSIFFFISRLAHAPPPISY
jgi:hypothetical protein